jgi:hypothetical protein
MYVSSFIGMRTPISQTLRTNTRYFMQVFMNIVLDDAVEEKADGGKDRLGMVVRSHKGLL